MEWSRGAAVLSAYDSDDALWVCIVMSWPEEDEG